MVPDVTTRPLSPAIGVEIDGLDLSQPVSGDIVQTLQVLLDRHALLSFPRQSLTIDQQIRFTSYFGDVCDENLSGRFHGYVSNRRPDSGVNADSKLLWHSDNMWSAYPTLYLVLYGSEIVGDLAPTLFASNARACKALDDDLRKTVSGLHTINMCCLAPKSDDEDVGPSTVPVPLQRRVRHELPESTFYYPRTTYPIIWRHPRTGEELLTAEEDFSARIEGLAVDESEAIYQRLFDIIYDEHHVYAHHWRQGDVVIWDNIALQHGRPDFQGKPGVRTLARTSVQPMHDKYLATAPRVHELSKLVNAAQPAS
jgi:alpha-ketoglutarate-dependent taurine dioxygenase